MQWTDTQINALIGKHDQRIEINGVAAEVQYDYIGQNWWASLVDEGRAILKTNRSREALKAEVEWKLTHDRPENRRDDNTCRGCGRDWFAMVHGC